MAMIGIAALGAKESHFQQAPQVTLLCIVLRLLKRMLAHRHQAGKHKVACDLSP